MSKKLVNEKSFNYTAIFRRGIENFFFGLLWTICVIAIGWKNHSTTGDQLILGLLLVFTLFFLLSGALEAYQAYVRDSWLQRDESSYSGPVYAELTEEFYDPDIM